MFPEENQIDELLSGYLDGALSSTEQQQVEALLASDASARSRLDSLRELQQNLRTLFSSAKENPQNSSKSLAKSSFAAPRSEAFAAGAGSLGASLASRVIHSAQQQAKEQGLPQDHFVFGGAAAISTADGVVPDGSLSPRLEPTWGQIAGVFSALAAALLLFFVLPSFLSSGNSGASIAEIDVNSKEASTELAQDSGPENPFSETPSSSPRNVSPDESPIEAGGVQYVSEMEFPQILYVLLVDIEVAPEAVENNLLARIFRNSGILLDAPIVANDDVSQAISEARMLVTEEDEKSKDAMIYFLRAPIADLGNALDRIYLNEDDFPRVSFDLGFDTRQTNLLKAIAGSTGTRFAVNQTFAAPLSVSADGPKASSFDGLARPAKFVSSEERQEGFGEMPPALQMMNAGPRELENVLLFIRIAD